MKINIYQLRYMRFVSVGWVSSILFMYVLSIETLRVGAEKKKSLELKKDDRQHRMEVERTSSEANIATGSRGQKSKWKRASFR